MIEQCKYEMFSSELQMLENSSISLINFIFVKGPVDNNSIHHIFD